MKTYFGTAVTNDDGTVIKYEGGIIHKPHPCRIPMAVIMGAIADIDWHNHMGASDYTEVANLICYECGNNCSIELLIERLNDWEVHSGCYMDHDFATMIATKMGL